MLNGSIHCNLSLPEYFTAILNLDVTYKINSNIKKKLTELQGEIFKSTIMGFLHNCLKDQEDKNH